MNNIYVDELPKCCEICQMNCSKKHNFISCLITDCDGCIGGRPKGCPLKKLSDRLAEERKRVVQEIREHINDRIQNEECFITRDENGEPITTMATICSNYTINELSYIIKFLDQIERGE